MTIKNKVKIRGFTLVETLVAIAILLLAVVGPISLIGDALHKMYYAKDEIIAINLAQEGVEIARGTRDSNMLAGIAWDTGLGAGDYVVSANPLTVSIGSYSGMPQQVFTDPQGYYSQIGGTLTQFKRLVTISSAGFGANERKLTATVTWSTGGTNGSVSVTEYIFNWATP